MKLSSRDIRIIEDVLSAIEAGETCTSIGVAYRLGKHSQQGISTTVNTLERLGVAVPKRMTIGERRKAEWAECIAWKAAQRERDQSFAPIVSRSNGAVQHHAD